MATRFDRPSLFVVDHASSPVADNFSLTRGGPLYRVQRRLGGSMNDRVWVRERALASVLITWLPLLILSMPLGLAYGDRVRVPLLRDFAANARFLIAVPLLILAEIVIDRRLRVEVKHFLISGLVRPEKLPSFESVLRSVTALRDHALPEILMLAAAVLPFFLRYSPEILLKNISCWQLSPADGRPTYAGLWFGLVSAPLFRFLLFRWLWRMMLWALLLWRVSRIGLVLTPTDPDLAAGLGFLSEGQSRFSLVVFAGSVVIAGQFANAVAYRAYTLDNLKYMILGYCAFAIVILLAPLFVLLPTLVKVKSRGLLEYGVLGTGYAQQFDAKWVHGKPPDSESLLGSPDLQSLADLKAGFEVIQSMRLVPIDKGTLMQIAIAAVLPIVPVLLMATPADELMKAVLKLLA